MAGGGAVAGGAVKGKDAARRDYWYRGIVRGAFWCRDTPLAMAEFARDFAAKIAKENPRALCFAPGCGLPRAVGYFGFCADCHKVINKRVVERMGAGRGATYREIEAELDAAAASYNAAADEDDTTAAIRAGVMAPGPFAFGPGFRRLAALIDEQETGGARRRAMDARKAEAAAAAARRRRLAAARFSTRKKGKGRGHQQGAGASPTSKRKGARRYWVEEAQGGDGRDYFPGLGAGADTEADRAIAARAAAAAAHRRGFVTAGRARARARMKGATFDDDDVFADRGAAYAHAIAETAGRSAFGGAPGAEPGAAAAATLLGTGAGRARPRYYGAPRDVTAADLWAQVTSDELLGVAEERALRTQRVAAKGDFGLFRDCEADGGALSIRALDARGGAGAVVLDGTGPPPWEGLGAPRVADQLEMLMRDNERERRRTERGTERHHRPTGGRRDHHASSSSSSVAAETARKHLALLRLKEERRRVGLDSGSRNKQR